MTDAPTILSAFRYVHEVLKQTALLLQTSDQVLAERDWEGLVGNTCFDETSTHIQLTRRWLPHVAHRFYGTDAAPLVLLFVSVLLDDRNNEYEPMDECLLTAGAIVCNDKEWGDHWKLWWGRWHGFQRPRHDDGRIIVSERKDWAEQSDADAIIERVITKGVPLPTVRSTDDLRTFLEPLLREVEVYREGS